MTFRPPLFAADLAARSLARLGPERAHALTVKSLAYGLGPKARLRPDPRLAISVAGLDFPNPLGLAPGFDKNNWPETADDSFVENVYDFYGKRDVYMRTRVNEPALSN